MKFKNLIERIKLPHADYLLMKIKARQYDNMMSAILCERSVEYEDACDAYGNIVAQFPKSKKLIINVDIEKILEEIGVVVLDTNAVEIKVKGYERLNDVENCF